MIKIDVEGVEADVLRGRAPGDRAACGGIPGPARLEGVLRVRGG
jgi:hypothetical protein